ncbi:sigma 54-interacting transcriptional regulator [Entomomonas sp. E2T0]|uniref:sigma-54 interaction domain-containing protein n=1 Tax=Entomomonas sp. E2T0 TaxID=2930213 RepID=UPI0022285315|nr:sigma 54-interacting transcriptional regulator [Entomomonas sp. E2T0]UYZ84364.1 sigma 54-interacting transcriptional regulator [Entomomonas sp. E2T0]
MDNVAAKYYSSLIEAESTQDLIACVLAVATTLTSAELAQLYLLDQSKTKLNLYGQSFAGKMLLKQDISCDYYNDVLLQYCLTQNKSIISEDINSLLLEHNFLPQSTVKSWRSLLVLPLLNKQQHIYGLLVCAGYKVIDWHDKLTSLESFCRLMLIQYNRLITLQVKQQQPLKVEKESAITNKHYGLVGSSQAMKKVYSLISKVLHTPYTVLITGETGTGKELVAKAIHQYSSRKSKPFIVQNCASMPEALLESELFGYCKGAFTGADKDYLGLFREADGGTLFLDEIGDMPLVLQAKLLRVLQESEVRPLGSSKTYKVNVRIIAATHRHLLDEIGKGSFREDLYYRLAKFPIELPPLRDRDDDIVELVDFFINKTCQFLDRKRSVVTQDFMDKLLSYSFPGNIRELKGLLERAILLADDELLEDQYLQLDVNKQRKDQDNNFKDSVANYEREHLVKSLRSNQGNQTKTAKQLGISRRTLIYKLQKLNISKEEFLV